MPGQVPLARGRSATEPKRGGVWFDPQATSLGRFQSFHFPSALGSWARPCLETGGNLVPTRIIDAAQLREDAAPGEGGAAPTV